MINKIIGIKDRNREEMLDNVAVEQRFQLLFDKLKAQDYSKQEISQIETASKFLIEKQFYQKRITGERYILHSIDIALDVIELGLHDLNLIIAALYHDIPEDTTATFYDVAQKINFTKEVSLTKIMNLLIALTNPVFRAKDYSFMSEGEREVKRIIQYQQHVLAAIKDEEVLLLKALDIKNNALKFDLAEDDPRLSRLSSKYLRVLIHVQKRLSKLVSTYQTIEPSLAQKISDLSDEFIDGINVISKYAQNWEFNTLLNQKISHHVLHRY